MVKTTPQVIRVVLDTNVLVSALLFGGVLNRLVAKWKTGDVVPVFSQATFDEFRRVLAYPRFDLTESEIRVLIEDEVLPYFDIVETREDIGVHVGTRRMKFFFPVPLLPEWMQS